MIPYKDEINWSQVPVLLVNDINEVITKFDTCRISSGQDMRVNL